MAEESKSEDKVVYKIYQCHLCTDEKEFSQAKSLRKHFKQHEEMMFIFQPKPGRRPAVNGFKFIKKDELENHPSYKTWYMCPGCDSHFMLLENLASHINNAHVNKASSSRDMQPITVRIREPTMDLTNERTKRRCTFKEVNQKIFNYGTPTEAAIGNNMLKEYKTSSSNMTITGENKASTIPIVCSKDDYIHLTSYRSQTVKIDVELAEDNENNTINTFQPPSPNYINDFLQGSRFDWLLKNQEYVELNKQGLDLLNHDWSEKPYIRVACGQLLAGAILVQEQQVLLINGIELYNRKRSCDPHHERFGSQFMTSSIPTVFNAYPHQLNIILKIEDRSQKLILGTKTFNGLVISSKRLDTYSKSEVGPSTYSFTPSDQTRVFVSSKMIKMTNETVNSKEETSQYSDFQAQLRQVRSSLTNPLTYSYSRFFSMWTDQLAYRPYTIFTIKDKSNVNDENDYMIGSRILSEIAYCMVFNNGILDKSRLGKISHTSSTTAIDAIHKLLGDDDTFNLIGNTDIEEITMELAATITNNLKAQNESVVGAIEELMKHHADYKK